MEQVRATDEDPDTSPNGQVRYRWEIPSPTFVIDSFTGIITVAPGVQFDASLQSRYQMFVSANVLEPMYYSGFLYIFDLY